MKAKWVTVVALASLMLVAGLDQAQAQQKWKAVATSRPTPQFELWTWLAAELDKRTNGQVKMDVVSLPELGLTGFELVRVTRAGLVDVSDIILTYVAGDVPAIEGVDLPGLFPNMDASVKAHVGFMPAVKKNEDKLGGVVLGGYLWPSQYIFSRKPVKGPADLKGLKVRVYGTALTEFARALGMEPVSIAFAETYTALERGTVDAAVTGTYPGFALKFYEVSKYLIDVNIGMAGGAFVVSKRTWDKLSPEHRATLTKLGEDFSERGWDVGRRTTKEGLDKNKEKGMELIAITPAMAAASKETVTKVVLPSWLKRAGPDGTAMFNQYLAPYAGFKVP
jgi:TRAP-type C4-dicarboxylate transport system substrate-binding protein